MSNVYYDPQKFGLSPVHEIEWREPCYDFDLTVLWKDESGNFFGASDSGCSCPSPFETHDLTTLTKIESLGGLLKFLEDAEENAWSDKDTASLKAGMVQAYQQARRA